MGNLYILVSPLHVSTWTVRVRGCSVYGEIDRMINVVLFGGHEWHVENVMGNGKWEMELYLSTRLDERADDSSARYGVR